MPWKLHYPTRAEYNHGEPELDPTAPPEDIASLSAPWVKEQILAARLAADIILKSAAVGTESYDCSIELSGHGNRDHKPAAEGEPAVPADEITVTIKQLTAADAAALAAKKEKQAEAKTEAEAVTVPADHEGEGARRRR